MSCVGYIIWLHLSAYQKISGWKVFCTWPRCFWGFGASRFANPAKSKNNIQNKRNWFSRYALTTPCWEYTPMKHGRWGRSPDLRERDVHTHLLCQIDYLPSWDAPSWITIVLEKLKLFRISRCAEVWMIIKVRTIKTGRKIHMRQPRCLDLTAGTSTAEVQV